MKTLQDLLFLNPMIKVRAFDHCAAEDAACGVDMAQMRAALLPTHCDQFVHNLTFLERPIADCGRLFRYQRTEMGVCFVANGLDAYALDADRLPLRFGRAADVRRLEFAYAPLENAHYHVTERPYVCSK